MAASQHVPEPPLHPRPHAVCRVVALAGAALLLGACAAQPPAQSPPVEKQSAPEPLDRVPADSTVPLQSTQKAAEVTAQPPPPEKAARKPCAWRDRRDEELLDETKRRLQETLCSTALWFDGLFGDHDRKEIAEARGASGRVELSGAYSEFYGTDYKVRFNARMPLPNLKQSVSAFVGRDSKDSIVRDRSESFALRSRFPKLEDEDETIAGLGYALPENYTVKTEFRTGVRLAGFKVPKLFAQARFAANVYSDERNLVDLRATPFVNTNDGFGITVSGDVSHVLAESRLLRYSNIATITQKTAGLDWRSALILYQGLWGKSAIAYETFVRGATAAPVPLTEYGVQAIYRQPLARERLYGSLLLGYGFPKEDPALKREGSYSVGAVLEMPFGGEENLAQ